LNDPTFKEKLREISSEIGISENSIIKLMKHESGLDSSIKNSIGLGLGLGFSKEKAKEKAKEIKDLDN
jgi:hypothetical protein